jgi:putative ABC transport system ATP-binding protein
MLGASAPTSNDRSPQRPRGRMRIATAELTVIGLGNRDPATSRFLGVVGQRLAAQQTVSVSVRGMGALLEGPLDEIFALAAELHRIPLELGMPRFCTVLKVEQRSGVYGRPSEDGAGATQSLNDAQARGRAPREPESTVGDPVEVPLASRNGLHHPSSAAGGGSDTTVHEIAAGLVDAPELLHPASVSAEETVLPPPVSVPASQPVTVRVAGLTKTYGEGAASVEALKGVDLEIRRGEFVAVMGPSGSGKSTLMHILGALEAPSRGTVEVGGVSYAGLNDSAQTQLRRNQIGFVFQFFNLLKTLSAEENVMLPSLIAGERGSKLRDRARELLDVVGLSARRDHLPSQMSGGEQQRVSIARALTRDPQILLADEPTGNLDSRNSAVVLDLLGRLRAESNHTILMVTHDPGAASRATRVVFLRDGMMAGEVSGGDQDRIVEYFSAVARTED